MSIKCLGNNKYKITIECGYDILGERKRKTKVVNGREEAIREEALLKSQFYHTGQSFKKCDLSFEQLSNIFIKKYAEPYLSFVTTDGYIKCLKKINTMIGKKKIKDIDPLILTSMYQKLSKGESGQELGYCSKYNYYKIVNAIFNKAMKWGLIDKNPNIGAEKPKKEHKEKCFYDMDQVKILLSALDNEPIKYKALIQLALDSGARRGELVALRWSDIDLDNRIMNINKSLKVLHGRIDEKTTKTESSIRKVILTESTIELLSAYKEWQEKFKKINSKRWIGKEDRIFTSIEGKYMHPSTCDHIIRKIVLKYDLDPIPFHGLRHTCASMLINMGVNPKTVSKRLGHSDTAITMDLYTHCFESSKLDCAEKMNTIMNKINGV